MGGFSLWHWLIVGIVILLLFGKGRFSDMMGDVAKGVKAFKKGMNDDDEAQSSVSSPAGSAPVAPSLIDARPVEARPVETRSAAEIIADYERQKAIAPAQGAAPVEPRQP